MDRGTPPATAGSATARVLPLRPLRRRGREAARAGRAAVQRRASGTAAAARAPSLATPRAAPPSPGRPAGVAVDRHGTPPPATAGSASRSRPADAAGHRRQGATALGGIGPDGAGPGGTRGGTQREWRRRRTGRPCGAAGPRSARSPARPARAHGSPPRWRTAPRSEARSGRWRRRGLSVSLTQSTTPRGALQAFSRARRVERAPAPLSGVIASRRLRRGDPGGVDGRSSRGQGSPRRARDDMDQSRTANARVRRSSDRPDVLIRPPLRPRGLAPNVALVATRPRTTRRSA